MICCDVVNNLAMLSLQDFVFTCDAASAATTTKAAAGLSGHDWYACKTVK